MHGLVCGFGKRFSCGTITVMHQVGGNHPAGTGSTDATTSTYVCAKETAILESSNVLVQAASLPSTQLHTEAQPPHQMEIKSIQDE